MQLLGIYPPGTLVKLASESVAVVTRVHAPDPYRPRVRVLFGADGTRSTRRSSATSGSATPDGSAADSVAVAPRSRALRHRPAQFHRCRARLTRYCRADQLYCLVTEGLRTVAVAGCGLAIGFAWHAIRTSLIPPSSPDRLVSELRLGQFAALLLTMTAGVYIGFAVGHEAQQGVGFDVAFAVGFLIVAASTMVRDPRQALTVLALAFAAHAVLDVAHRPGVAAGCDRAALVSDRVRDLRCRSLVPSAICRF